MDEAEEDMDDYAVEAVTYNGRDSVTKMKSFNMEPITVDEAVLCIEYIDYDFVFRNKETGRERPLEGTGGLDSSSSSYRNKQAGRQAGRRRIELYEWTEL